MQKHFDVVAFGELVIDMIPISIGAGQQHYVAMPGGAPGNVAAGVARLGLKAAMLSKVGPGAMGDLLIATLEQAGVDVSTIIRSQGEPTAMAVVSLNAQGDRDFALYREGSADASFGVHELPLAVLQNCKILHVGSLSLGAVAASGAQRLAVETAKQSGALISTDVNFRPAAWRDHHTMLDTGQEAVSNADIVKLSAEELLALTGIVDPALAIRNLWRPRLKLLAVTHGADGAEIYTNNHRIQIAAFPTHVVDTVGCGDAFMAALLAELLDLDIAALQIDQLQKIIRNACAAGAFMASVPGAMEHMPRREDIAKVLAG